MKQQLLLFLALVALVFNACNGDKPTNTTASQPPPSTTAVSTPLSIYSYRYLTTDAELFQQFEGQANKKVNIYLSSGANTLELAKKGHLKGDILIVEDLYQAHQLKKLGIIEHYHAGTFEELVLHRYIDNEGYWAGLSRWTMSNVFRSNKVNNAEMQTYAGVLNPKYKGRIVVPHPDSSGLVTFVASMLAAHGKEATSTYLRLLNKNLLHPPAGSDFDALQSVLNNEADIAFMNGSAYLRFRNSGNIELYKQTNALSIEIPLDAQNNNYYNISPACIVKNAPNRNYAIPMIEFLTIADNQNIYAERIIEYPVNIYATTVAFLDDILNTPQGNISMEDTENQLDTARELIQIILGV